jgi:undecaprenyl pyrophosphate phosphatase UppP
VGHLIGFEGEKAKTFDMVIQLGAILAIVLLYRNRLSSLFNIKPIINKENKFNAIHIILGVMSGFYFTRYDKDLFIHAYYSIVGIGIWCNFNDFRRS